MERRHASWAFHGELIINYLDEFYGPAIPKFSGIKPEATSLWQQYLVLVSASIIHPF